MYEKQVYKDGIRRTVLTTSDAHTFRYFSRDELTHLFKLMPAGECNMIQRLRHDPETVVGGSGKKSILADHPQVVGITSHDSLYQLDSLDFPANTDSTTISNPNVKGRSARVLSSEKEIVQDAKDSTSHLKEPEHHIEQLLRQIDDVTLSGDIDQSLSMLLDATALEGCKGPSRLMIHKKIAARAIYLGLFPLSK